MGERRVIYRNRVSNTDAISYVIHPFVLFASPEYNPTRIKKIDEMFSLHRYSLFCSVRVCSKSHFGTMHKIDYFPIDFPGTKL